jgi:hypothetical protein
MKDQVIDVNAIIEPPPVQKRTPAGELIHFMEILDAQIGNGDNPQAMVLFGAARARLMCLRTAMQCGVEALNLYGDKGVLGDAS